MNQLPKVIDDYIRASNKPDPAAFVDCFADDAFVVDEGQERRGKAAIKKWSDENHFAAHVTLEPTQSKQIDNETIVTCKIDGTYDKTGLPDPLFLDFHFCIKDDKIATCQYFKNYNLQFVYRL
jgi:uncharacterized protein (TIGR02246 family)